MSARLNVDAGLGAYAVDGSASRHGGERLNAGLKNGLNQITTSAEEKIA